MRLIGIKLLALTFGFVAGVVGAMLMPDVKRPSADLDRPIAAEKQPVKGYDFFSPPEITATWKPDPVSKVTSCHDPKIEPIWNAIRRDKELREKLDQTTQSPD